MSCAYSKYLYKHFVSVFSIIDPIWLFLSLLMVFWLTNKFLVVFFMLNMVLPLVTNNSKYWNDNPQQKKADDKKKGDFIKKLSPHWSKHVILL